MNIKRKQVLGLLFEMKIKKRSIENKVKLNLKKYKQNLKNNIIMLKMKKLCEGHLLLKKYNLKSLTQLNSHKLKILQQS